MNQKTDKLEPYVGPRPFQPEEGEFFFGRRLEVNDLISLITAYPVVLLYAQSGAGKTSLLNASLIPQLEGEERYTVLKPARVRKQGTSPVEGADIRNVFIFNALSTWKREGISHVDLAQMSLKDFLKRYPARGEGDSSPMIIVFDQFEEIFTHHLDRWEDREDFFEQIRDALEADTHLRVYFVMREDYIAELDPYAQILPGKLRTRFRMERLRRASALEAIKGPLEAPSVKQTGRHFAEGVAEALVDDLLKVHVQTSSSEKDVPGQFVEPVQLQVVCQLLWQELSSKDKTITFEHLKAFGDVNEALTRFYERTLTKASDASGVSEGALRRWFDRTLITPDGNRSTVLRGKEQTAGLPNSAIEVFETERLLRSEPRDGRLWYELSQDRLIRPIQSSYKKWLAEQPGDEQTRLMLEDQAASWARTRDEKLLLDQGQTLVAKRWIAGEASGNYSEELYALVQASEARVARDERERERALTEEQRLRAEAETQRAERERALAEEQRLRAEAETQRAAALEATGREQERRLEAERLGAMQSEARVIEQSRANRRLKFMLAGVAAMFLLSLATTAYAFMQRSQAQRNAQRAAVNAQRAEANAKEAATAAENAKLARAEAETEADRASAAAADAKVKQKEAETQKERADREAREAKTARAAEAKARIDAEAAAARARAAEQSAVAARGLSEQNAAKAQTESQLSKSRELAANAQAQFNIDPELGMLLAIKAADPDYPTKEARDALLKALAQPRLRSVIERKDGVGALAAIFSPDAQSVLTLAANGDLQKWAAPDNRNPQEAKSIIENAMSNQAAVAVSGDGKRLVVAQADIKIWEIGKDSAPTVLKGSGRDIRKIGISPDGEFLIFSEATSDGIANSEGNTLVYDVSKQEVSAILTNTPSTPGKVTSLEFSADGYTAAVVQGNMTSLWNTNPAERQFWAPVGVQTARGPDASLEHIGPINVARFSRDGQFVVTASDDRTARRWSRDGKLLTQLVGHEDEVVDASFNRDGDLIVTASKDRTARVWDAVTGRTKAILRGHKDAVTSVRFSDDGKFVVTTSEDNTTRVWELKADDKPRELVGHAREIEHLAISPNGGFIATAGYDGTVRVWSATGDFVFSFDPKVIATQLGFSSDGKYVFAAKFQADGSEINMWNLSTGRLDYTRTAAAGTLGEWSNDGSLMKTVSADKFVITATKSGKVTAELTPPRPYVSERATNFAVSADNKNLAVGYSGDERALVWNLDKPSEPPKVLKMPSIVGSGAFAVKLPAFEFSPNGKSLLAATLSGKAWVWDLSKPDPSKVSLTLEADNASYLRGAHFSPDGKYISTWADRTAWIWDASTGVNLWVLSGHTEAIANTSFSPDSRLLVTASKDGTARVWDLGSGNTLAAFKGHAGLVSSAIFGPNMHSVITTSYDYKARIFPCDECGSTKEISGRVRARAFREALTEAQQQMYLSPTTGCESCGDLAQLIKAVCKRVTRYEFLPDEKTKFQIPAKNLIVSQTENLDVCN